jgi:hypothetical protein
MKSLLIVFSLLLLGLNANASTWKLIHNNDISKLDTNVYIGSVSKVAVSKNGDVFFVCNLLTKGSAFYLFKEDSIRTLSTDNYPIPLRSVIYDLFVDDANNLLVATEFGLLKWDGSNWSRFIIQDEFENTRKILKIMQHKDQLLLFAESFKVVWADSSLGIIKTEVDRYRYEIIEFESDSLKLIKRIIPENLKAWFEDMCIDDDGNYWFTSFYKLNQLAALYKYQQDELLEFDILDEHGFNETAQAGKLFFDGENIILGTDSERVWVDKQKEWIASIITIDKMGNIKNSITYQPNTEKSGGVTIKEIKYLGDKIYIADNHEGLLYLSSDGREIIDFGTDLQHPDLNEFSFKALTNTNGFDYFDGTLYIATAIGLVYGKYELPDTTANSITNTIHSNSRLKVFPNILSSESQFLTMSSEYLNIQNISIYDIEGKHILSDLAYSGLLIGEHQLFIPKLASGKYFLIFKTDTGHLVSPILVTE